MSDPLKITIHMVSSLDGMIARADNSMSWFETTDLYEKGEAGLDVWEFLKTVDCYIMGSRTYELALELSRSYGWAYGDTPTIVMTSRGLPVERESVETYSGTPEALVNDRLKPSYRNVWVVGGAALTKSFITAGLADEIRMSVLPIILGGGKPFFENIRQEYLLHLSNVVAYRNGMVELCYDLRK